MIEKKKNRSGEYTRKWILETALKLFNEHGSHSISTKRIAAEMGISSGNLYYHFKNKEEIIREIFADIIKKKEDLLNTDTNSPLHLFINKLNVIFLSWKEYVFFKRELYILLDKDPELRRQYYENIADMFKEFRSLFQGVVESKAIKNTNVSFDSLMQISWMICEHWINFLDINKEPITKQNLLKGIELVILVWRPYLDVTILDEIDQFIKKLEAS